MKHPLLLLSLFLSLCLSPSAPPALAAPPDVLGDYVMHLYIGTRLFDDRVRIERAPNGALVGTFTVVGGFTAPLRNLRVTPQAISFDIVANEGGRILRVRFDGLFHRSGGGTFVGYGTMLDDQSLLGGFVARKLEGAQRQ